MKVNLQTLELILFMEKKKSYIQSSLLLAFLKFNSHWKAPWKHQYYYTKVFFPKLHLNPKKNESSYYFK